MPPATGPFMLNRPMSSQPQKRQEPNFVQLNDCLKELTPQKEEPAARRQPGSFVLFADSHTVENAQLRSNLMYVFEQQRLSIVEARRILRVSNIERLTSEGYQSCLHLRNILVLARNTSCCFGGFVLNEASTNAFLFELKYNIIFPARQGYMHLRIS